MTEETPSGTFPLTKAVFEGLVTFAVDARDLHRLLKCERDFPDWILEWIDSGKFHEFQDFIRRERGSSDTHAEAAIDFLLSIDMAKEIAFFDESPNRNLVRRLLIDAQKTTIFYPIAETRFTFDRPIDQMVEIIAGRLLEKMFPVFLSNAISDRRIQVRYGKTSGQIWDDLDLPKIGLCPWFGNRLRDAGCQLQGYGELGKTKARLYDPDKVSRWLAAGGKLIVERKIEEKLGQGQFEFMFPSKRA